MTTDRTFSIAPLGSEDLAIVQWVLYTAVGWNDPPGLPALEVAIEHPDMVRYHRGWGRNGDFGVRAEANGSFAGAAFARRFTAEDHGHGYVDEVTPEIGIAIEARYRGHGLGRQLMDALAQEARRRGIDRLALSVNNPNPAKRLYEFLGYETLEDDGDSSLMLLAL